MKGITNPVVHFYASSYSKAKHELLWLKIFFFQAGFKGSLIITIYWKSKMRAPEKVPRGICVWGSWLSFTLHTISQTNLQGKHLCMNRGTCWCNWALEKVGKAGPQAPLMFLLPCSLICAQIMSSFKHTEKKTCLLPGMCRGFIGVMCYTFLRYKWVLYIYIYFFSFSKFKNNI